MPASKALKLVNDRDPQAKQALLQVAKEKPVILNRAPSLHKHSLQAFNPVITDGKEIKINPLVVSGFNADFDGDTMSIMTPVSYEAEQDARNMFPSRILFKHGDRGLVPGLAQEYVYGISKLSELGKKTNKTFKSINEAKAAKLDMTDQFTLNGQTLTLGQWELNKVLPKKYQDYSRVFKGGDLNNFFNKIAREQSNDTFATIIDHYKNLGAMYAYKHGGTISIDDMVIDRSYRDKLLKKFTPQIDKIKDPEKKIEAYLALNKDIGEAQDKALQGKNRMLELIDTGALSKSKSGNVKQVLSGPGIVTDTNGNPIPIPIFTSYSEGLDTFSYFNTFPGVRKGIVDRSVNTQQSGALNKTLLSVNRRQLIVEEDCGTTEGLTLEVTDKNVLDRTALVSLRGIVKRGEVIDSSVINKAKEAELETLKVRSPLTCDSSEGICQKCYGTLPNGQLPNVGTNVGILESQALTERSTQLTMKTFHTGGAAGGKKDVASSFPRLEQILKVPQKVSGKATLAPKNGKISDIKKNSIGGFELKVGNKILVIPPGRELLVKNGDVVKKGEPLSDGVIKPQELGELKSHLDAQRYMVDEIDSIYDNDFHKKSIETVIRGISDNAEVVKAPKDSGLYRGDKASMSYLKKLNRERRTMDMDPIEFKPYFKSVDTLNVDNDDWLTKITTNRIKDGLSKGMAKMQWTDIAGRDPIPAYLYGDDFGKPEKKREDGEGFY